MKKITLFTLLALMISAISFAQDLKPKKDKATKKYGYVNSSEEWAIQPTFDKAAKFDGNTAIIVMDKKTGLIDQTGKIILEPQFDDIDKFKDGFAIVKLNKQYGFINTNGEVVCKPIYDDIGKFESNGIAEIKIDKKLGLINTSGTVLLEPSFDKIGSFSGNTADVQNDDLWGLIDITGKVLFKPEFVSKIIFNKNDIAVVSKVGTYGVGKFGVIKKDGSVLYDFDQLDAQSEGNKFFIQSSAGKYVICDEFAKPISGEFDNLRKTGGKFIHDGMIKAKNGEKWGFIDGAGQTLIPFNFDEIGIDGFKAGYCAVKVGDKWGYIEKNGKYFKTPLYEEADSFSEVLGETLAKVKLDGKMYTLNAKTGAQTLMPGQTEEVEKPAETTVPTLTKSSTATTKATTTTAPTASANDWIVGKWVVTEEIMGGKAKTGTRITYVSFEFKSPNRLTYLERNQVTPNNPTTKSSSWKLSGSNLKMMDANFTVVPSADKKSMTLKGILGSSWKLVKK